MIRRVKLPAPVAAIYCAVRELEALYPARKFTPDGHLVGSIGEVVAAEALNLKLHPPSWPGHDAFDCSGDVQIKMTAGKSVALYANCDRLVVLGWFPQRKRKSSTTVPVNPPGIKLENPGKMVNE